MGRIKIEYEKIVTNAWNLLQIEPKISSVAKKLGLPSFQAVSLLGIYSSDKKLIAALEIASKNALALILKALIFLGIFDAGGLSLL